MIAAKALEIDVFLIYLKKRVYSAEMNKTKVPNFAEIDAALEASGQAIALAEFRAAISRGDKIGAIKVARQAGILSEH